MPSRKTIRSPFGHTFKDPELLERALTHRSLAYETSPDLLSDTSADNEQLEFVGDAVLGLVVAESLYRRYPQSREGELTRLRASIVSRKHLGAMAARIDLGSHLRLGKGEERSGGRAKSALLSNALEAVIAAIYLDGGLKPTAAFIEKNILEPALPDITLALATPSGVGSSTFSGAVGDHKSALQEHLQAAGLGQPEYVLLSESGPDHQKRFHIQVRIQGHSSAPGGSSTVLAESDGPTKKAAQQEAARLAFLHIRDQQAAPSATSAASEKTVATAMMESSDISPAVAQSETQLEAKVAGSGTAPAASIPAGHPRSPESHSMIHAMQSLLYIIIIAIFIITFAFQPFRIPSESMEPTLLVGDFLLVAKQNLPTSPDALPFPSTPIQRGDVIVFHFPVDPSIHLIKRVVGLPGDHLRLRDNHVYIDGQPLAEPYAAYRPGPADNFRDNFPRLANPDPDVSSAWWIQMHALVNHGELTVPPHSYFVLGDNRNNSEDSRYWGFVPASAIVGKPLLIYFSVNSTSRSDDDDIRDPDPTPRASALPTMKAEKSSTLAEIANFARWDRTLRIVR